MRNIFGNSKTYIFFLVAGMSIFVFLYQLYVHESQEENVVRAKETVATHENRNFSSSVDLPQTVSENTKVKILFGGDMMFDRYIREKANISGYDFLFAPIADMLKGYDRVVANLEGPITSQSSKSVGSKVGEASNYVFTFDEAVTKTLYAVNIRTVSIGNNHIMNFGKEGLEETESLLADRNILFFGNPLNPKKQVLYETINGIKIAFVTYNQFAVAGHESALQNIKEARSLSDIVIVYTHWGTEYETHSSESIRKIAHGFIDVGADAIIGSHPHVVQESEEYKGKKIYYSLGNFIFDQYFSNETKRGLLVEMDIDTKNKEISFRDIPINLKTNGQVVMEKN